MNHVRRRIQYTVTLTNQEIAKTQIICLEELFWTYKERQWTMQVWVLCKTKEIQEIHVESRPLISFTKALIFHYPSCLSNWTKFI